MPSGLRLGADAKGQNEVRYFTLFIRISFQNTGVGWNVSPWVDAVRVMMPARFWSPQMSTM